MSGTGRRGLLGAVVAGVVAALVAVLLTGLVQRSATPYAVAAAPSATGEPTDAGTAPQELERTAWFVAFGASGLPGGAGRPSGRGDLLMLVLLDPGGRLRLGGGRVNFSSEAAGRWTAQGSAASGDGRLVLRPTAPAGQPLRWTGGDDTYRPLGLSLALLRQVTTYSVEPASSGQPGPGRRLVLSDGSGRRLLVLEETWYPVVAPALVERPDRPAPSPPLAHSSWLVAMRESMLSWGTGLPGDPQSGPTALVVLATDEADGSRGEIRVDVTEPGGTTQLRGTWSTRGPALPGTPGEPLRITWEHPLDRIPARLSLAEAVAFRLGTVDRYQSVALTGEVPSDVSGARLLLRDGGGELRVVLDQVGS